MLLFTAVVITILNPIRYFCPSVKKRQYTIEQKHKLYSLLMLCLLAWLTVCLPYVSESQKTLKYHLENITEDSQEAENSNPLTNTNEERTESSTSLFSEYLHDLHFTEHTFEELSSFRKCSSSSLYLAYHPEMVIPPPEA